jgi:hypothetical protein
MAALSFEAQVMLSLAFGPEAMSAVVSNAGKSPLLTELLNAYAESGKAIGVWGSDPVFAHQRCL